MSQTVLIQQLPSTPITIRPNGSSLDTDFDGRWAAWGTRGTIHDRAVRRNLLMPARAMVVAVSIVYLLLIR